MSRKRYTRQQLLRLLGRLVAVTEAVALDEGKTRSVLGDLLSARIGEVWVRPDSTSVDGVEASLLRHWRLVVRDLVRQVVGIDRQWPGVQQAMSFPGVTLEGLPFGGDHGFEVRGKVDSLVWMQTIALLRAVGRDHLRLCECGKVFVAEGKRKNCSLKCQKRYYMRKFRAGDAGRE